MQEKPQESISIRILDGFSKVAVVSTFILGFAYLSGYVYNWVFYKYFRSSWVLSLYSPQDFIRDGLPWVSVCTVIALIAFNRFKHADAMRRVGMAVVLIFCVVVMLISQVGYWMYRVNLDSHPLVNGAAEIVLAVLFSSAVAMSIKMMLEGSSAKETVAVGLLGLVMTLVCLPAMRAVDDYGVLRQARENVPVVMTESGKVIGVLLGAIAGKFLIYDCSTLYKLTLHDITSGLSVAPAPMQCRADA